MRNELYITGTQVFLWFGPRTEPHRPWCTLAVMVLVASVFCFMSGSVAASSADPGQMFSWTFGRRVLDVNLLIKFGGRFPAVVKHAPYRLLTYAIVHQTGLHFVGNALIFVLLGTHIEPRYGCPIMGFIIIVSVLGGALFSTCIESTNDIVVGLSGAVLGVIGLFCCDLLLHWKILKRPLMRSFAVACAVLVLIAGDISAPNGTSHLTHVGGFLTGFVPSLLVLPRLGHEHIEAWVPWCAATFTFFFFLGTILGTFLR
jgi:membrane associated rhomboid family serine protease